MPASTPYVRADQNQNLLSVTDSNSPLRIYINSSTNKLESKVYQLRSRRVDKSIKRRLFIDEEQNSPKRRAGVLKSGKANGDSQPVFITKWLDDYQNNGLGCKLSDGLTTIMLKDGTTGELIIKILEILSVVRGVHESNVEMVKGREAVNISWAREGQEKTNLKLWKQFDSYMAKHLLQGIEADLNTSSDLRTSVLCFNRQSRSVCFLLSNGVRQVSFCL